mgnify:CR=1 FL=1
MPNILRSEPKSPRSASRLPQHGITKPYAVRSERWVEVTEFLLHDIKIYLSPVLDLYNGEHFLQELDEYLRYYNEKRIKEKLNGMSPVQYRTHNHMSYC